MSSPNTLAMLQQVDIFQGVPAEALEELLATAETRGFERGETIFREREPGDAMYLVVEGAVELTQSTGPAADHRLALLDHGQIFGELALFDHLPRSATAEAFVKTTLLRFPAEAFDELLDNCSDIAPHLLRNLVRKLSLRLRDADQQINELSRAAAR
ncbi:MAG TPA: cyclic nucleotide-binding domain-containing protein [Oscillatoriaceae cyanobacterium]